MEPITHPTRDRWAECLSCLQPVIVLCKAMRFVGFSVLFCLCFSSSQAQEATTSTSDLKELSLEDLMNIEVVSVSKRPEKLLETASAIQVVTDEDIKSYGATNIAEALYLAGNLQVAQSSSNTWRISSRGFNTETANKLLVLMDGRTVYTPLYGGVFWDRQDYLLEDLQQIEVISGPGGTLWGVNAVNGVINITTKSAAETQGLYLEGAAGNELRVQTGIRYGGKLAPNIHYRVYGRYSNRDNATLPNGPDPNDDWQMGQGGFRIDAKASERTHVTLQGDLYDTYMEKVEGDPGVVGGNALARLTHTLSDSSSLSLQTYYDRTYLRIPSPSRTFEDDLTTFDVEFQHRFRPGKNHHLVWGIGYRFTHDEVTNSPSLGFDPEDLDQNLFTVFAQDEITLFRDLFLTVGSKLEHNAYVGFVVEPSTRIRWNLDDNRIVWASVSRAVRAPSRIDRDVAIPPDSAILSGNDNFKSETVIAYETGFRSHFGSRATTSVSLFYNQYDDVRSAVLHPETVFPVTFENGVEGETYGLEFTLTYQVAGWWQLFTSYNFLEEDLRVQEGKSDINNARNEWADPKHQFSVRSSFTLPYRISINPAFRWVDDLIVNDEGAKRAVASYKELNAKISWEATSNITISAVGRNLLHNHHLEYDFANRQPVELERSVYGKIVFRL